METTATAGEDRVLTLPNAITVVRLLCVPAFVWLLVRHDRSGWLWAAVLLAALGATDWVDGYLARRLHQVSTVGKVLDPVADRVLLSVGAISIVAVGAVPIWVAVVALAREATVVVGALIVAAAGGRRLDVQWAGKAGTFALMFAFPLFLAGHSTVGWHQGAEVVAWVATVPGLVFGWYAAIIYVPLARRALLEGRHSEALPPGAARSGEAPSGAGAPTSRRVPRPASEPRP